MKCTCGRSLGQVVDGKYRAKAVCFRLAAEGESFQADRPRVWSERRFMLRPGLRSFDLHPDGERFVLAAAPENESVVRQDKLVFIFNFFDELRRLAPAN